MSKRTKGRRRAFGSISKRGRGSEIRYYIRFGWDGKRANRAVGPSKPEAQRFLAQAEALCRAGESWERALHALFGDTSGAGVSFRDTTKDYLRAAETKLKASTHRTRTDRLGIINEENWAAKDIAVVRTLDLQRWFDGMEAEGLSAATRNRCLSAASAVFKWARLQGLVHANPAHGVQRASEAGNQREVYVTEKEAEALVKAASSDFKPYVRAALETGCRSGELRSLRWRDVDLEAKTLTVRAAYAKTKTTRAVPLTERMAATLKGLCRRRPTMDGSDHVFLVDGEPITKHVHRREWEETRGRAKPLRSEIAGDLHFHDLRHSCASFLLGAGIPLDVIGQILGHTTTQTTRRYAHLAPTVARAAMEQLDRTRKRVS